MHVFEHSADNQMNRFLDSNNNEFKRANILPICTFNNGIIYAWKSKANHLKPNKSILMKKILLSIYTAVLHQQMIFLKKILNVVEP